MKITKYTVVLAAIAFCASSAFAADKATVNIPFSFEAGGHSYPAGQYVAQLDLGRNIIQLNSTSKTNVSARWTAGPADFNPNDEKLILKFDDLGSHHMLRTVQLGPRITSRLDAPARQGSAGSAAMTVSGQ